MHIEHAVPQDGQESEYLWLQDSALPRPREDRVAEVVALLALLFSLSVGLVIAMLPVSAKAAAATRATRESSVLRMVAAVDAYPVQRARKPHAG